MEIGLNLDVHRPLVATWWLGRRDVWVLFDAFSRPCRDVVARML